MARLELKGLSSDQRTNQWHVVCDCRKGFTPPTTTLAWQEFRCPACKRDYRVNYNAGPSQIVRISWA